nr:MAG TPA: ComC family protein [Caudoviricetes sp.]
MDKKKIKTYKKLSAEALQELLRIRRKIQKIKEGYI